MVVQARLGLLGAYEEYLRPYIGKALADGIDAAQPVLDAIMPSNKEDWLEMKAWGLQPVNDHSKWKAQQF